MPNKPTFIFDFDSTLTSVEALEVLAELSLEGNPNQAELIKQIEDITNKGVNGEISFTQSLEERIKILKAHKSHLAPLVKRLSKLISPSIKRNKKFFEANAQNIYVVSAGFKEFIDPIVTKYGIAPERIYANTFKYDKQGNIIGFDKKNHLSKHNGKIAQVKALNLKGEIIAIGDGYSDYLMKEGGATKFIAFTENIARHNAVNNADHVAPNFDEVLFTHGIQASVSYPKNRILFSCLPNDSLLKKQIKAEGFSYTHLKSIDDAAKQPKTSVLIVSEADVITEKTIVPLKRLMAVGVVGKQTTSIDLLSLTQRGIAVFNIPYKLDTEGQVNYLLGKLNDYINKGYTQGCVNLPNLELPKIPKAHRLLHIHKNKPGMLAKLNTLLWAKNINVIGQYLKTKGDTGYLIVDINHQYDSGIINDLRNIEDTVRFRVLY